MRVTVLTLVKIVVCAFFLLPLTATAQCTLMPGSVLTDSNDETNMTTWLGTSINRGTLVYRMTRDGDSPGSFHSLCDNQGPTLVIIRNGDTGEIFGGYNPASWDSSTGYRSGTGAFLFNLTYDYRLNQLMTTYQSYNYATYGPTFGGGHDIYVPMNGAQGYNSSYSYESPVSQGHAYISGQFQFIPSEIEVFKLDQGLITVTGSTQLCAGNTVTLTAPVGDTYLWSSGQTTSSIVVSETGDYSVQVSSANPNCPVITASQSVVVSPPLSLSITTTNASAPGACDGSVSLEPSGGSGTYTTSASLDFSGTTINSSALSYGGGSGATFIQDGDLKMKSNSNSWDNYVFTNQTTVRSVGKTFEGKAMAEEGTYSMIGWRDGTTNANYTNLVHSFYFQSGYVYIFEKGTGAFNVGYYGTNTWVDFKIELQSVGAKYYLRNSGSPDWLLVRTTDSFSDSNLRMGVAFYGYAGTYPNAFFHTDDWSGTGVNPPLTDLCAGTYQYTIVDSFGCSVTQSATISDSQTAVSFTATATNTSCSDTLDGSITVTATGGTAPYQYSSDGGANYQASNVFTDLGVGAYEVVVKDAGDNTTEPQTIEIVVEDATPPIVLTQNMTVHLSEEGTASVTADQINNGSSDGCGIASITLNQTDFDCSTVGDNTVILTVTDVNDNEASASAIVTVIDDLAPTITPDADVFVDNDLNLCFAEVGLVDPAVEDNCDVATITNDHPSGIFPVGETIVTWTVTDVNGNSSSATQLVTVTDTEAPVISVEDVTVDNTPGFCSAEIEISPIAEDNCGIESITRDYEGTTFPVGETTVTWTVVDVHGNESTVQQVIVVNDSEIPEISSVNDITVNNDPGLCGAELTLTPPVATDNCGIADFSNDFQATLFPVGETIVTWTATDVNGNTNTIEQTVTVNEVEAPVFEALDDIELDNISGSCTAEIDVPTPSVEDNCGVETIKNDHESAVYEVGITLVNWTATDINGNTSTATQRVIVYDTEQPTISGVDDVSVDNLTGKCAAEVFLVPPTATDNCGIASITSDYPSAIFPVGETIVTWTATDIHGNASETSQIVIVNDTELPTIATAADISAVASSGTCSAEVTLVAPAASDNCQVESVTNDYGATTFEVGETVVTWTVTDVSGNINTSTQKVTITDTEAPVIAVANLSFNNKSGLCSADVDLTAAAKDNCGVATLTNNHLSSIFPVGETVVTWTATDIHGNSSTALQTVTVIDNESPKIKPGADVVVKASKGCAAEVKLDLPETSDNCSIASVTNDHPSNNYPVGTTAVTWTVTDATGNTSTAIQKVTVTGGGSDGDIVVKHITPSSLLLPVYSAVTLKIEYKGSADKVTIDWGDGTSNDYKPKSSPFSAKHTYGITGVHTVGVVLSSACGSSKAVYEYIVTYNPEDGFVAGSGWINSPVDACSNEWKSSSRANFGFVSKARKGDNSPNGETKFHFIAGNINFVSTAYEYLKVSESHAKFRGTGTINGSGNYNFQVTAVDGKKDRFGTSDKFRIRITQGRKVIYDNQRGDDDWDNCKGSTALAGGSIIISIPDKKNDHEHHDVHDIAGKFCEAFPNPIRSHVSVRLFNPNGEKVLVYLMDMTGKNLQCRELPSSEDGVYHLDTDQLASGAYILKVIRGTVSESIKVLKD